MTAKTASVIMAAGRGSRMKGFEGNKTLLPLISEKSPYQGRHPILVNILKQLPSGPKVVVVHHKKEDIIRFTKGLGLTYCEQPRLNGTGGALLAARRLIEEWTCRHVVITMGDVPLVNKSTYEALVKHLKIKDFVVLGFCPESKKQYGVLEIEGDQVHRIIEWKYWKTFSEERQTALTICNSGIYAARKEVLLRYLSILAARPHLVYKDIQGKRIAVEEFFVTDLVEYMHRDGLQVGCVISETEREVMGVDDLEALKKAQEIYESQQTS
jgi:bifunctional UDP-N-acetylglucosamine pyrophosphorylase/glucosamine-1-phosphate N-acetyltransferase